MVKGEYWKDPFEQLARDFQAFIGAQRKIWDAHSMDFYNWAIAGMDEQRKKLEDISLKMNTDFNKFKEDFEKLFKP